METWSSEFLKLVPSVLWWILTFYVITKLIVPVKEILLPRLSGVKGMGIELTFIGEAIEFALELAEKNPNWEVYVSPKDKDIAVNRAKRNILLTKNIQILWIDDNPENNINETKMFKGLGIHITTVNTTGEGIELIKKRSYNLVLSDMARGDSPIEGLNFLEQLRSVNLYIPLIFYVGLYNEEKGVPSGAFGITNRPDELLHLVLDVVERQEF